MIPRTTEGGPPSVDPAGKLVEWIPKSFLWLVAFVQRSAADVAAAGRDKPGQLFSAWWAQPGKGSGEAMEIDVAAELVKRAYSDGTYFVRCSYPDGTAHYFQAPALGAASEDLTQQGAARTVEIVLSRGLDTESAIHRMRSDDLKATLEAARTDRREINRLEDIKHEQGRRIKDLEAQLEAAKEDAEPIFSDEATLELLELFKLWAMNPEGGQFERLYLNLFGTVLGFLGAIERDPEIMRAIATRHAHAWSAFRGSFNKLAEESKQETRLASAERIVQVLPSAARAPRAAPRPAPRAAPRAAPRPKATKKRASARS